MAGVNYTDEEMGEAQPQRNTNRKTKGRGFQETGAMDIDDDRAGAYDTHSDTTKGPVKCKFQQRTCYASEQCLLLFEHIPVIFTLQL